MPEDLEAEVRRLTDPATAEETVHWGRNYLYRTWLVTRGGERFDVVVKQFRNLGARARLERRFRGSKAERSWRMALAYAEAGVATADAVALIESTRKDGPSFFVTRYLEGALEARYLFRARNAGREAEEYPSIDFAEFLERLGRQLARMHEAGLFHRDLSIGNVLVGEDDPETLYVVDLNRARRRRRLGLLSRTRDLCRLALFRPDDQRRFLTAYWGGEPGLLRILLYKLAHHGFRAKIEAKGRWRALLGRLRDPLAPRRAHAHIPAAPGGAPVRDKIVWDHLSDQPHQHAGRFEKLRVRLSDLPSHLRDAAAVVAAAPAIVRRYRELGTELYSRNVPWRGAGVCVRPCPEAPGELLAALDDLGVRHVLVRLHPWAEDDRDELELARELDRRGYDLAFSLPQNRDLVRDSERWRRRVTELAETFTPYGRHFQVGQAVNRSKWGTWTLGEYVALAESACEVLRRHEGVQVLGPAVIDFEPHATVAALRRSSHLRFDAVSSLLYVDRRGAPENRQLGFDTVKKILLLHAIAETAPGARARSWVTEVNWPLWEGPHSPAGRSVSVEEPAQADFLARYYLLALTTGLVERVYWWQLVARGYGLIAPADAGCPESRRSLRRRASFEALATLERELRGSQLLEKLEGPPGAYLFHFRRGDSQSVVAGWSATTTLDANLPRAAVRVTAQDGEELPAAGNRAVLTSSVRYFHLESGQS